MKQKLSIRELVEQIDPEWRRSYDDVEQAAVYLGVLPSPRQRAATGDLTALDFHNGQANERRVFSYYDDLAAFHAGAPDYDA